ncbi:hypothetical protein E3N88_42151 [Mikania micrantha]|uniref:Secreted protein n=1 Tax=Mikania micrantha TaxID=192012 RepID=A0A5N6LIJ6_9ASTR|nr:hypothetical protein E3N88_42151 [Mikania micrantha]
MPVLVMMLAMELQSATANLTSPATKVEFTECDCCGLTSPAVHLITTMRQILRLSLDSARSLSEYTPKVL